MSKQQRKDNIIKFATSRDLKADLERLAQSRNISLSALLRLVLSEYLRNKGRI